MKYMMFVVVDPDAAAEAEPSGDEPTIEEWLADVDGRGERITGDASARSATPPRSGSAAASCWSPDGPFTESKEWIVGFDILDCDDLDEAIAIAARHPQANGGKLELRPSGPTTIDRPGRPRHGRDGRLGRGRETDPGRPAPPPDRAGQAASTPAVTWCPWRSRTAAAGTRPSSRRGRGQLRRAAGSRRRPGPYRLQAELAACHATASPPEATAWGRIVTLYDALLAVQPSPVAALDLAPAPPNGGCRNAASPSSTRSDHVRLDQAQLGRDRLPERRRAGRLLRRLGRPRVLPDHLGRRALLTGRGAPYPSGEPGRASWRPDWVWRTKVALSQASGMVVAST